jgi:hypothetical protein
MRYVGTLAFDYSSYETKFRTTRPLADSLGLRVIPQHSYVFVHIGPWRNDIHTSLRLRSLRLAYTRQDAHSKIPPSAVVRNLEQQLKPHIPTCPWLRSLAYIRPP